MNIKSTPPTDAFDPRSGYATITLSSDEASMLAGERRALADIAGRNEWEVELDLRRASDAAENRERP